MGVGRKEGECTLPPSVDVRGGGKPSLSFWETPFHSLGGTPGREGGTIICPATAVEAQEESTMTMTHRKEPGPS